MTKSHSYKLDAIKRTQFGHQTKQLRRNGVVPANIFGKGFESTAIQVDSRVFAKLYEDAGETNIVQITIDADGKQIPTLISDVTLDPVSEEMVHVDFRYVDLTQKITANVPVEIIGESLAVKNLGGTLVVNLDELEVEALPDRLPESFVIDISVLETLDDNIAVSDLKVEEGVEILADPETMVVTIQESRAEEEETTEETTEAEVATPADTKAEKPEADQEKAEKPEK